MVGLRQLGILILILLPGGLIFGQSFNHWTRSFNEESSFLSGAVVGGGAGPSAIYYNPGSISEITESKLSLHASLFSFKFYNIENALGDGIDLKWSNIQIEPRFLSYMIKPKKNQDLSFEFAMLNNENYQMDIARSVDYEIDILNTFPGNERYFATVQYRNRFRDDWFGAGGSWRLNPHLSIGMSMFVTIKSMEYSYNLDIEAYPLDSLYSINYAENYSANYQEMEYLKYNDYRLLWKIGVMYKRSRYSIGVCVTTPSVGGIYSDGKRISKRLRQSGITSQVTGQPMPNYFVGDYKEKKDVKVNHKSPYSVSAGFTYHFEDDKKVLYTTAEYFGGLDQYVLASAEEGSNIGTGFLPDILNMNEFLTFISGANPVLNGAIGYRWGINEDLLLMIGFRTDFNYLEDIDYNYFTETKTIISLGVDNYHFSGGLSWKILGQDLVTGIQYTLGMEKNQPQFVNLSDPVEFNYDEMVPLQGTRQNNMNSLINGLSLYFGATFSFGGK